ncbi:MAG: dienelactone hydrolase family protein [Burkholderiales bacterium]|nr:dienelactone hydrolase family protein [Burkholderiales bacterium]
MARRSHFWRIALGSAFFFALVNTTMAQGYFREEIAAKDGKGPAVLIISGQTGPDPRRAYARDVAALGYNVLLVDGNDMLSRTKPAAHNFKDAVSSLLAAPNTTSKKVAVIGFSLGGGALLSHALHQPDVVVAALAVYPFTAWIQNVDGLVGRLQVPLTVLAAGADSYNNCCLIDKAREIEKSAKAKGKAFDMVVYENAEHGYDLTGRNYRHDYTRDTWQRTEAWLKRVHADTAK